MKKPVRCWVVYTDGELPSWIYPLNEGHQAVISAEAEEGRVALVEITELDPNKVAIDKAKKSWARNGGTKKRSRSK